MAQISKDRDGPIFRGRTKLKSILSSTKSSLLTWDPQISTCCLLALPAEIRNKIYTLSLSSTPRILPNLRHIRQPALTLTCRQIQCEALPLYFAHNDFLYIIQLGGRYIIYDQLSKGTKAWTKRVSRAGIRVQIRSVVFGLEGPVWIDNPQREVLLTLMAVEKGLGMQPSSRFGSVNGLEGSEVVRRFLEKSRDEGYGPRDAEKFVKAIVPGQGGWRALLGRMLRGMDLHLERGR